MKTILAVLFAAITLQAAPHVVMISIDGFRPAVYLHPDAEGVRVPNLQLLRDRGAWADRMIGVFPTVTYPSHTTLVTGTRPATHGVIANFLVNTTSVWVLKANEIKSETLWQAAHKKGLTTGIVTWPMSYGAGVDWLVPENLSGDLKDVRQALHAGATPGLMEALEQKTGRFDFKPGDPDYGEKLDTMTGKFAAEVIREHKPELMLLHFLECDEAQHNSGPGSPAARRAYEAVDAHIGGVLAAIRDAGIESETNVIIVGDHGFLPIHSAINLTSMLMALGYAGIKDGKVQTKLVDVMLSGSSGAFYPKPGVTAAQMDRFRKQMRDYFEVHYHNLLAYHSPEDLRQLGGFPGAIAGFSLNASGFTLAETASPDPVISLKGMKGTHGFHPDMPEMSTGFIAAGPAFAPNFHIGLMRMVDVAPTLARVLNIPLPGAEGWPVLGILRATDGK